MTDYLEEVLEEETEDWKEFQPKRVVVRGPRRERPDVQEEDGAEGTKGRSDGPDREPKNRDLPMADRAGEETTVFLERIKNSRRAIPGKDGILPEKGGPGSDLAAAGEVPEEAEEAGKEETGDFFTDLVRGRILAVDETERSALRQGEQDIYPPDREKTAAITEELAEAERLTRYGGTEDAYSETVPSGALSAWRESGREGAAGILLRALGRAGRVSRIVHGGSGTAVVTTPGETTPAWEPDMESLDRLVRLDARRYDGGFQLF